MNVMLGFSCVSSFTKAFLGFMFYILLKNDLPELCGVVFPNSGVLKDEGVIAGTSSTSGG